MAYNEKGKLYVALPRALTTAGQPFFNLVLAFMTQGMKPNISGDLWYTNVERANSELLTFDVAEQILSAGGSILGYQAWIKIADPTVDAPEALAGIGVSWEDYLGSAYPFQELAPGEFVASLAGKQPLNLAAFIGLPGSDDNVLALLTRSEFLALLPSDDSAP